MIKSLKINIIYFYMIIIINCSFFPPIKLSNDKFFNIENELPGTYKGIKIFLNRYNVLTGFSIVYRECKLINFQQIQCKEDYSINNKNINKEYCIFFEYLNPAELFVYYKSKCNNKINYINTLLKSFSKIRGGGFYLISKEEDPMQTNSYYISFQYIRGLNNTNYYLEQKNYYLLFWYAGKEITIWERIENK